MFPELTDSMIAILGIIVGAVLTILVTIITLRQTQRIAERSGAFNKPNIKINFLDLPDKVIFNDMTSIYLLYPGEVDDIAIFPLKFTIHNLGSATLENPILVVLAPIDCALDERVLETEIIPGVLEDDVKSKTIEHGNYIQYSYKIPAINPSTEFSLEIPFTLPPAYHPQTIDATTNDGYKVSLNYTIVMNAIFSITILGKDRLPTNVSLRLAGFPATARKEAVEFFDKVYEVKKPFYLLKYLLSKRINHVIFIQFDDFITEHIDNKNILLMNIKKHMQVTGKKYA
jgi:hypothetical protein